MLMGVSDNRVAVNTRDDLEKGLTFVGSSRSGREDFERAVEMLANRQVQSRLKNIIHVDGGVQNHSRYSSSFCDGFDHTV